MSRNGLRSAWTVFLLMLMLVVVVWAQGSAIAQDAVGLSSEELELVEVDWFEEMMQGGFTMVALAALSVGLVAFVIERGIRMRGSALAPDKLLNGLLPLFQQKRYDQIQALCKKHPSALADIAMFLVAHRKADPQILITAAGDLGARAIIQEERRCQPFAVIAGIAPLLGLLGTMIGMIESFKLVEVFGDEGGASLLAGSISKALITTAVGLILAIPALIAYHGFKHRAQSIGMKLEIATETLFNNWFLLSQSATAPLHPAPPKPSEPKQPAPAKV